MLLNLIIDTMNATLLETIEQKLLAQSISPERQSALQPLVNYLKQKIEMGEPSNLNFICTHNSRRSHFSQIWAQVASAYYEIPNVHCYSGGTEETALFPSVLKALEMQGLSVIQLSENENPVYAIKWDDNAAPLIGFSKKYDSAFNPKSSFAAIMTCSQADEGCPFIPGAEARIPLNYRDPKYSDGTSEQAEVYLSTSLEIAKELFYVFSQVKNG